jgi:gas vesicle protein
MADSYDRYDSEGSGGGFMMGLLTGTVLGAGLGMLLAPKAGSDLRGALGEQARNIGSMANEQYRKASEAAGGWSDKGREFVDKARDAVSRGVEDARGYAGSATGGGSGSSSGSSFGGATGGGTSGSSFGGSSPSSGSSGSSGGFGGSSSSGGSDSTRS